MFGLPWDQTLGALMFVGMIAFLFFGFPVAFSLTFTGLFFGLIGFGLPFFDLLPLRIWGTMSNFTLLAVPLFVFMGVALEKSGLAEELLETMALLFGRLRGDRTYTGSTGGTVSISRRRWASVKSRASAARPSSPRRTAYSLTYSSTKRRHVARSIPRA